MLFFKPRLGFSARNFSTDEAWGNTRSRRRQLAGEEESGKLAFHLGFPKCGLLQGVCQSVCIPFKRAIVLLELGMRIAPLVNDVRANVDTDVGFKPIA